MSLFLITSIGKIFTRYLKDCLELFKHSITRRICRRQFTKIQISVQISIFYQNLECSNREITICNRLISGSNLVSLREILFFVITCLERLAELELCVQTVLLMVTFRGE